MINMFRRLTAKEWGMIALSTVFYLSGCFGWILKTPEYLSDITTLLAKDGTKVSDIMDPGSKMLLFSFWKLFDGSFCGLFWLQESLPALRRDLEERFSIK